MKFVGAQAYSYQEVVAATGNFKKEIGKGGFGPVFYGKLNNGQEVAIKVLDIASRQGSAEFFNEVCLQICLEILYDSVCVCVRERVDVNEGCFILIIAMSSYVNPERVYKQSLWNKCYCFSSEVVLQVVYKIIRFYKD